MKPAAKQSAWMQRRNLVALALAEYFPAAGVWAFALANAVMLDPHDPHQPRDAAGIVARLRKMGMPITDDARAAALADALLQAANTHDPKETTR